MTGEWDHADHGKKMEPPLHEDGKSGTGRKREVQQGGAPCGRQGSNERTGPHQSFPAPEGRCGWIGRGGGGEENRQLEVDEAR